MFGVVKLCVFIIVIVAIFSGSLRNVYSFTFPVLTKRHVSSSIEIFPNGRIIRSTKTLNHNKFLFPALTVSVTGTLPRLTTEDLKILADQNFVVVPNFLSSSFVDQIRSDVRLLRAKDKFAVAKIGQDATNQINTNIRVAETCFLGRQKHKELPSEPRETLYEILDWIRHDLEKSSSSLLDSTLSEFLYAYYPKGGYYRRHRDAIPGSASTLRSFSLLLYLNDVDWSKEDGGELRMHFDGGGDFLPAGVNAKFIDVDPTSGTLVLFKSDAIPHEVLDTQKERVALVGWYNRPVSLSDVSSLSGTLSPIRMAMIAVAFALVSVGLVSIIN